MKGRMPRYQCSRLIVGKYPVFGSVISILSVTSISVTTTDTSTALLPTFRGRHFSHLQFPRVDLDPFCVTIKFMTSRDSGLLLFNKGGHQRSFVSLAVQESSLRVCLSCGGPPDCKQVLDLKVSLS